MDYAKYAKILKVLSDPKRLKIVDMLTEGELCACKIQEEFNITQPTLSHDMKLLCDAGIASARKEGKWMHYTLNKELLSEVYQTLGSFITKEQKEEKPCCVEGADKMGNKQTKLYVLTGFLGSGKTTLLLKLLKQLEGKKVGIIQNEFGKLGIDGTILRNDDIQMVEINRGSIFCSCLKLTFVQALAEMVQYDFDYLFVESSGLGDPSNVEEILKAVEVAAGKSYDFGGVICLVDAANFMEQLEDEETVYRQLKHCHLAAITKADLVGDEEIEALEKKIREINPVCKLETSVQGNLDISFLDEDLLLYQWAESEDTTNTVETKPKTLSMEVKGEVTKDKLVNFLNEVIPSVYRMKGFLNVEGEGWQQVDVVGSKIDFKATEEFEIGQLVFISKIGPAVIKQIFAAWEKYVGTEMKLKN